jgi:CO/xanthine dehydrogenase FAD-binding subunit
VALEPPLRRGVTGSCTAAPPPPRAREAEEFAAEALPWAAGVDLDPAVAEEVGARVAAAAAPIDDVRAAAGYRRHALAVLARRALAWTWAELRGGPS